MGMIMTEMNVRAITRGKTTTTTTAMARGIRTEETREEGGIEAGQTLGITVRMMREVMAITQMRLGPERATTQQDTDKHF